MRRTFIVNAQWDIDAGVWVATSEDIPGFVTEATTPKSLTAKLRGIVPDLLKANSLWPLGAREVVVDLHLVRREQVLIAT